MRRGSTIVMAVLLVGLAPPLRAQSRQELYDTAQAAFDRADWPAAVTAFRRVVAGLTARNRTAGIIHTRLAYALEQQGDIEDSAGEAATAIALLTAFPPNAGKDEDLATAYLTLGAARRHDLQLAEAGAAYARALDAGPADTGFRFRAVIGYAFSMATVDPAAAATRLDGLIADPGFAALPAPLRAQALSWRSVAALNLGRYPEATAFADKAQSASGALGTKVSLAQVQFRGNAALAFALRGDDDNAKKYLAYAGAGHLKTMDWLAGADTDLPVCDDEVGPQDVAVVEFAIGDDGQTAGALPIYASKAGTSGRIFAAAVREWRWRPDAVARLDPFWRASVRMELRCVKRPPPLRLDAAFRDETQAWLAAKGITADLSERATAGLDLATGGRRQPTAAASGFPPPPRSRDDVQPYYQRVRAVLATMDAPVNVRAYAAYRLGETQRTWRRTSNGSKARTLMAALPEFDGMAGAARAQAWLRTEAAIAWENAGDFAAAAPLLDQVVALPPTALPADDPIRTIATLHRALIDRRAGSPDAAAGRITAAKVDPQQCSLLDVRPVARSVSLGSETFPGEAMRWGFEGMVREAFDVEADGSVSDVRTVISYPPMVFNRATERGVARFRYLAPQIEGAAVGCTGQMQTVNFRLPGR